MSTKQNRTPRRRSVESAKRHREFRTNFERYVSDSSPLVTYIIANHLWLEHLLLSCLKTALPAPAAVQRCRFSFPALVALCEAHNLIRADFGNVLLQINALRNKYAHRMSYNPRDAEVTALIKALREMKPFFYASFLPPSEHEMARAMAAVSGHLERQAQKLGVPDMGLPRMKRSHQNGTKKVGARNPARTRRDR